METRQAQCAGTIMTNRATHLTADEGTRGDDALRFSVVVPFIDESRWLPGTLAAIDRQTFPASAFELLFVDNGSSDGSEAIIRRHPRATILHEPRRDPYLARNRGIHAARGEYVVFLDADCPPEDDWLAALSRAIHDEPADVLIGSLLHPKHSPRMLRCYEEYYNRKLGWLIAHRKTRHYFGHAGNMAVRREVFAEIGPFKAMPIVGDTEIIHRLLQRRPDAEVRFVPAACVVHAEVDSVQSLLGKLVDIGGYSQSLIPVSDFRPVGVLDKLRIAADTLCHSRQRWMMAPTLLAMLGAGWVAFAYGRLRGLIARAPIPPRA